MARLTRWASKYFYGNEISNYGLENGYVDYGTLAKSFDCVLNNSLRNELENNGFYFEMVSGLQEYQERIEEIEEELEELEEYEEDEFNEARREELEEELEELENSQNNIEIFQEYIVTNSGASILEEVGEIVFYNESLDLYIWGVTHWGTSWDYVLTDIKLELEN